MQVLDATVDLDHCVDGCGALLSFFDRSIAHQRGEPRRCWTCERKATPPKEALHQRVIARLPTVLRLPGRAIDTEPPGPAA
jgi:hypothetical protein